MNNNFSILIIIFAIISLSLGITFAVLKSNNDDYVDEKRKSDPKFENNDSDLYLALSITFFILFILSLIGLYFMLKKQTNSQFSSPLLIKPIMSYDTPLDSTPNEETPIGLSGGKNYLRGSFPKFPNLDQ